VWTPTFVKQPKEFIFLFRIYLDQPKLLHVWKILVASDPIVELTLLYVNKFWTNSWIVDTGSLQRTKIQGALISNLYLIVNVYFRVWFSSWVKMVPVSLVAIISKFGIEIIIPQEKEQNGRIFIWQKNNNSWWHFNSEFGLLTFYYQIFYFLYRF